MFESVSLELHSQVKKAMFLEMLLGAFPSELLFTTTIESIPDSPPFKRVVHYISFAGDFENNVDADADPDADPDAEFLCLQLQYEALIHTTQRIPTITSTPLLLSPSPSPPQVIPNKSTISAADHLLTLINQFPTAPPAQLPSPSPLNFFYINITNPIPSNDPSPEPSSNPSARPSAETIFAPRSILLSIPSTKPRTALTLVPRFDILPFPSLVVGATMDAHKS